MKKIGIIILIIILVSLTISLFNILMFSIQHNKWNWFMSFVDSDEIRKEEYIRKEEKIDIKDIEKVEVEFDLSDLNVFFTEEEQIRVVQYSTTELKENELFKVDKSSSNIAISKERDRGFHFFYINLTSFDIYIPKTYEKSLEIKAVSGDIRTNDSLKFKNLTIHSTSGDIEMSDVEADNINIETVLGNIKLQNLSKDEIKLKTVSGDIEIESIKGNIEAKTTSGDIEIEEIEGKIQLTSTSGNIKSNNFIITGKSKVKTTSGNVKMCIDKEANCQMQAKSVSGDITFPDGRNVIGNEPFIELNIETVSGDIKLEKDN